MCVRDGVQDQFLTSDFNLLSLARLRFDKTSYSFVGDEEFQD